MLKNILFVDDNANLLQGLKRSMRPLREDWDVHCVTSGQAALEYLAINKVDIIVSDFRMPEMNGYELLTQVRERFPQIIRMILTGQPDKETYGEGMNVCHYFLWKPLDTDRLKPLLARLKDIDSILSDENLRSILGGIKSLPTLPKVYAQLTALLNNPECDIQSIKEIVLSDISLTMQILKMVNSAFIGLARQIHSIEDAIQYLGMNTLRSLVLAHHLFNIIDQDACREFKVDELWQHSLCTAQLTEGLMLESGDNAVLAYASIAGLLHDVGKLILMSCKPDIYSEIMQVMVENPQLTQNQVEQLVLGVNHAAVGAYLATLWGLPHSVVEAIYIHHDECPLDFNGMSEISLAVWHANQICNGDPSQSVTQCQKLKINPQFTKHFDFLEKRSD